MSAHTIPKLSRPGQSAVIARERLFSTMDDARSYSVTWVCGPPGAGKTTLVASYMEARDMPTIWFKIDHADTEPKTFLEYLNLAFAKVARRKNALSLRQNPELSVNLEGYIRQFFREQYSRIPRPCALVFDDFPEQAPPWMGLIIRVACEEVADDVRVVVVSRSNPPAEMAVLIAARKLGFLDPETLRFTPEEARYFAKNEREVDMEVVDSMHAATEGWPAGLVMMLMYRKWNGTRVAGRWWGSEEFLFDYFESQIFNNVPIPAREFLVQSAFLPQITLRMAEALCENEDAGAYLEYFHRNHKFVTRSDRNGVSYQYHGLFRQFLIACAMRKYSKDELNETLNRSAILLDEEGYAEAAISLFVESGNWESAIQSILACAAKMIENGRGQELKNWISSIPKSLLDISPWLLYWHGRCQLEISPALARNKLEYVFALMSTANDVIGQLLTVSSIVESHCMESGNFKELDRWITVLDRLLTQDTAFPSVDAEVRILRTMLTATMLRQPQHTMSKTCAERLLVMLRKKISVDLMVDTGTVLLEYYLFSHEIEKSSLVVALIKTAVDNENLCATRKVCWLIRYAAYCESLCDSSGASESYKKAMTITQRENKKYLEPIVYTRQLASSAESLSHTTQMMVTRLMHSINPSHRFHVAEYHYGLARIAMQQSSLEDAERRVRLALRIAEESGSIILHARSLCLLSAILYENGEIEAGLSCLQEARVVHPKMAKRYIDCYSQLLHAYLMLIQNNTEAAKELLRTALAIAKEAEYVNTLPWRRMTRRLYEFSLRNNIEVDFVRTVIKRSGLTCESWEIDNWPWPVRIYTLGRFGILLDDVPLRASGKTQRKPLDLLKLLIALGGREVSASAIIHLLWPGSEGDAGRATFDSAVHRLRKLLSRDDAIIVNDGRLTLNPHTVWVDVWAFERLLGKMESFTKTGEQGGSALSEGIIEDAFRLYQGNFLGQEEELPWILGTRDKLRSKWLRHLIYFARYRDSNGESDKAIELYQRGLELDPIAEELSRGLMTIFRRRGQWGSALDVYRRCRQMLSVVLGVKPSVEMEALCKVVREQLSDSVVVRDP